MCDGHRPPRESKGRAQQEGRRRLASTLPVPCAYGCGRVLAAGDDWVAAHVIDGDRSQGLVVACRSCNERAKGGRIVPRGHSAIVSTLREGKQPVSRGGPISERFSDGGT